MNRYCIIILLAFVSLSMYSAAANDDKNLTEYWISRLSDNNPDMRMKAAMALGKINAESAMLALITALKNDDNANVRSCVAFALGNFSEKRVVEALIAALKTDKAWFVRSAIIRSLGAIGDQDAIPLIIKALMDKEIPVRRTAAYVIGRVFKDKRAVPLLIKAFEDNDRDFQLRCNIAYALGAIGDNAAVPLLIKLLGDKVDAVRNRAYKALVKIGGKSVVSALIETLNNKDVETRMFAMRALRDIGDNTAVPSLIKLLNDDNSEIRSMAAYALGIIGDKKAVSALVLKLKESSEKVRLSAAYALGRINENSAESEIKKALIVEHDKLVKIGLNFALAKMGDRTARAFIIEALNDRNMRKHAVVTLSELKDTSTFHVFIELLGDKNGWIRLWAAETLGNMGNKIAVPALITVLDDEDKNVCRQAIKSLKKLTGEAFGADAAKWQAWWEANKEKILDKEVEK